MEQQDKHRSRFGGLLGGLAVGVAAALLLWPATSWMVRRQAASTVLVRPLYDLLDSSWITGTDAQRKQTEAEYPNDLQLQISLITNTAERSEPGGVSGSATRVAKLRALESRFPNSPILYATALRFATMYLHPHRDDEQSSLTQSAAGQTLDSKQPHSASGPPAISVEELEAYDHDAEAGERLDPDNAYFPIMRSVGLFTQHRDTDALAAMGRAASESGWSEYYDQEIAGVLRLEEMRYGNVGAIGRMSSAAMILFPHLSAIRSSARLAVVDAMHIEQSGNAEAGLEIRRNTLLCGKLLSTRGRSIITSLVGAAIERISSQRPGGAPVISMTGPDASDRQNEAGRAAFVAYLGRIGHGAEADLWNHEFAAGLQMKTVARRADEYSPFGAPLTMLIKLWIADSGILATILVLLALGMASALLGQSRWIRAGTPLPRPAARGIQLGLLSLVPALLLALLSLCAAGMYHEKLEDAGIDSTAIGGIFLGVLLTGGLLAVQQLRRRKEGRQRFVWTAYLLTLGTMGVCALALSARIAVCGQSANLLNLVSGMADMDRAAPGATAVVPGMLPLAVPFLLVLGIAICSRCLKVPLAAGMVRGLRGLALPAACLFIMIYGASIGVTLRYERAIDTARIATLNNEGKYLAELSGRPWPQ